LIAESELNKTAVSLIAQFKIRFRNELACHNGYNVCLIIISCLGQTEKNTN